MSTLQLNLNLMEQNIHHCVNIWCHFFWGKLSQHTSLNSPRIYRLIWISSPNKGKNSTQKVKGYKIAAVDAFWMPIHEHPSSCTKILAMLRKTMTDVGQNISGICRWWKKLSALVDNSCFRLGVCCRILYITNWQWRLDSQQKDENPTCCQAWIDWPLLSLRPMRASRIRGGKWRRVFSDQVCWLVAIICSRSGCKKAMCSTSAIPRVLIVIARLMIVILFKVSVNSVGPWKIVSKSDLICSIFGIYIQYSLSISASPSAPF